MTIKTKNVHKYVTELKSKLASVFCTKMCLSMPLLVRNFANLLRSQDVWLRLLVWHDRIKKTTKNLNQVSE
jgi:hypothetical protein